MAHFPWSRSVGLALAVSAASTATPAAQAPDGHAGGIDVSTAAPPPAPVVPRSHHVHDGFYLRGGLGVGPQWLKLDDDVSGAVFDGNDLSLSFDLMVGGSPGRGFTVGGALLFDALSSLELENDGRATGLDPNVGIALIGVFVDAFPDAKRGFHAGGALGLAGVNFSELDTTSESRESQGFGGALWLGHDFWVADEWSIGPMLRFTTTFTSDRKDGRDYSVTTRGLTLLLTGLYH